MNWLLILKRKSRHQNQASAGRRISVQYKIVTLARSGKLPEVMEVSQDFAKVMDKDELIDQTAVQNVIEEAGEDNYYDGAKTLFVQKMEKLYCCTN